jgi:hypothetical protein
MDLNESIFAAKLRLQLPGRTAQGTGGDGGAAGGRALVHHQASDLAWLSLVRGLAFPKRLPATALGEPRPVRRRDT